MPCGLGAAVPQRRPYVPGQEGEPERPDGGIKSIERKIDFRRQGAKVMKETGDDQRSHSQDRDSQELG